jgi:hypothetical protein
MKQYKSQNRSQKNSHSCVPLTEQKKNKKKIPQYDETLKRSGRIKQLKFYKRETAPLPPRSLAPMSQTYGERCHLSKDDRNASVVCVIILCLENTCEPALEDDLVSLVRLSDDGSLSECRLYSPAWNGGFIA